MTGPSLHSVSVAAVITNQTDEILMIRRRDNGQLEPPGGVLELDESIHAGLIREVHEETGLEIVAERLTGVYKNVLLGVVALVFRARRLSGTLLPSTSETIEALWLSQSVIDAQCVEAFAIRTSDALRPTGVAVRAHNGINVVTDG